MSDEIDERETAALRASPREDALSDDDASGVDATVAARFCEHFSPAAGPRRGPSAQAPTLMTEEERNDFSETECALIAHTVADNAPVYLNVGAPFCLVAMGVQGAGKSHTTAAVLESCVLPLPPRMYSIVRLYKPMAALVFHYDQCETNFCEATGLLYRSPLLEKILSPASDADADADAGASASVPPSAIPLAGIGRLAKIVVLVSPTFYTQRKEWYDAEDRYEVLPMLFEWQSLQATQLKKLMRLDSDSKQLYVSTMLAILKKYQRLNEVPMFPVFEKEVMEACSINGQSGPLEQRFNILRDFIAESAANQTLCEEHGVGAFKLRDHVRSGCVIVADFTDPMMTPEDANGVFHVLLETFRQIKIDGGCGKIVVCDEAHKYLGKEGGGRAAAPMGLAREIVDAARMMRHDALRIVVSTQSPLTMPSELLELASVAVLHKFQSPAWYKHIASCVALPRLIVRESESESDSDSDSDSCFDDGDGRRRRRARVKSLSCFQKIIKLTPGEAVLCTRDGKRLDVQVRPRLTKDRGGTRLNSHGGASSARQKK